MVSLHVKVNLTWCSFFTAFLLATEFLATCLHCQNAKTKACCQSSPSSIMMIQKLYQTYKPWYSKILKKLQLTPKSLHYPYIIPTLPYIYSISLPNLTHLDHPNYQTWVIKPEWWCGFIDIFCNNITSKWLKFWQKFVISYISYIKVVILFVKFVQAFYNL